MPAATRPALVTSLWSLALTATVWLGACGGSTSTDVVPPAPPQPPPPPPAAATATPVAISAGGTHTCAVSDAGQIFCWGRGQYGALGIGAAALEIDRPGAAASGQTQNFAAVSAGYVHTCGVTVAGSAYCWGWNYERDSNRGALGDGTDTSRTSPTAVVDGHVFREVAAGGHHSCGATTGGPTYCWGRNGSGELGSGSTPGDPQLRPVLVVGNHQFHGFALGYRNSCALEQDGTAFCWGDGSLGQRGDGTDTFAAFAPTPVSGGRHFTALASAQFRFHVCGIAADSLAYCWGENSFGELGDGTTVQRNVPTAVTGGLKFVAIGAGGYYSCGLTAAGQVYCWGSIYAADRVGEPANPTPKLVAAPAGVSFTSLTVGADHACALTPGKVVYCWGAAGTVGDGTQSDRDTPTPVRGFKTSPP